ncbi:hypothetical protein FisN_2Hh485 [Fistulifera solaris]|jgi:hypothetical protein|uniref:Uncharacterized protein n=1 Tax=Fistulifera solaris TaxID=1519565 RepID=A0A1Z5JGE2_FISSO|nr:hypothetical protein FisN_2Hh485 [Fistulifera solaris]|eukprot:GAX12996.1 hypothetical protein FisN_2Hh485 [Fistulifera solaris]
MISQKARRQPPLVAYYNYREFVPTSHKKEASAPTIYESAYHRTAPSQQRQFQHVQPAVWYQKHLKANKNDVVREYPQPVSFDPVPHSVATPLMREELYAQVSSHATAANTTEAKHSRSVPHLAIWPMMMRHPKGTDVTTTLAQEQQQRNQHIHDHFIHWPHWIHLDQSSLVRDPHASHYQWSWRRSHFVGAGAA